MNPTRSTIISGSDERYTQPITLKQPLPLSSSQTFAINRDLLFNIRAPHSAAPASGVSQ